MAGATGDDDQLGGLVHEVVIQQTTKCRLAFDTAVWCRFIRVFESQRDVVSDSLVRSVLVVVAFDLFKDVFQMRLADQDQIVEGFAAFAHEPLRKGVALGRGGRRLDDSDAFGLEYAVEWQKR